MQLWKRIQSPVRKKVFFKIFLLFLLAISIPAFVLTKISYDNTKKLIKSEFIANKKALNAQIAKSIDDNLNSMQKESLALNYNIADIKTFLSYKPETIDENYFVAEGRMNLFLISILSNNDRFDGIGLAKMDGSMMKYVNFDGLATVEGSRLPASVVQQATGKQGDSSVTLLDLDQSMKYTILDRRNGSAIAVLRVLYDYNEGDKPIGLSFFTQGLTKFGEIAAKGKSSDNETLLFLSNDNRVVYSSGEIPARLTDALRKIENDARKNSPAYSLTFGDNVVFYNQSSAFGFKVLSFVPENVITDKLSVVQKLNVTLIVILAVAILILSFFLSNLITLPLKKLKKSFKQFETGDFDSRVSSKGEDEFAEICRSYNRMVGSVKALVTEKFELELLRRQSELEALQSKINPHFLYNTLSSIKAVIQKQDADKARQMVQDLSDVFRYTLNKGRFVVTLNEELQHIRKYLALQKHRFGDSLETSFDIDSDMLDCSILRLTIQPLVENAIVHGLEGASGRGKITISVINADALIHIYIEDNGAGIEPGKLAAMNALLSENPEVAPHSESRNYVGIYNVNSRIKLYFGTEYGVKVLDSSPEGTTVRVTIPRKAGEPA
ncbi:sensor histidine kinase [Cohnella soli]|uniref:Histidine kinase n=1 Tax=Cohnella soli TaxID=425005 RepID=A0ABW0HMV1_9BACL